MELRSTANCTQRYDRSSSITLPNSALTIISLLPCVYCGFPALTLATPLLHHNTNTKSPCLEEKARLHFPTNALIEYLKQQVIKTWVHLPRAGCVCPEDDVEKQRADACQRNASTQLMIRQNRPLNRPLEQDGERMYSPCYHGSGTCQLHQPSLPAPCHYLTRREESQAIPILYFRHGPKWNTRLTTAQAGLNAPLVYNSFMRWMSYNRYFKNCFACRHKPRTRV
jgi:hypothetical protein